MALGLFEVGVCERRSVGCVVVCSAGIGDGAAHGRLHCAEPRQHSLSICDGGPTGWSAAEGFGAGGGEAGARFNPLNGFKKKKKKGKKTKKN